MVLGSLTEDFIRCVSFDFIQSISDAKFGPLMSLELPMNSNERAFCAVSLCYRGHEVRFFFSMHCTCCWRMIMIVMLLLLLERVTQKKCLTVMLDLFRLYSNSWCILS